MSDDGDDDVVHDFAPLIVVYRSGRLKRPFADAMQPVPPGTDAATGVVSRDVHLSASLFVRLYLPPAATAAAGENKLPVIVYFHGGGFVIGSAASPAYHRCLNDLAAACPAIAVSVDYRLAPEHPLPAAYDDSAAALAWVLSDTDPWLAAHGDLSRVFLAGDSAGANICHHLAMHHGHDLHRRLKGIVLIHPWFWGKDPIGEEPRGGEAMAAEEQKGLWEFVCPDAVDGVDDPRMNPMAAGAPGLEKLACEKVMVFVAEGDTLRWRGRAYAEAAAAARARGGDAAATVELLESEGVAHVFYLFEPGHEKADELLRRIAAFVSSK
uniref:Alpha/beta hydrolase fold-3 domain-containing protein n=1 Tax=Leersia perrieri TaxID=77586 RepID=A0A0D9W5M5_9ORYZ